MASRFCIISSIILFILVISIASTSSVQSQTIFGSKPDTDVLVDIDAQTGEGSIIGNLGFEFVKGLACDTNTGTLYGTDVITNQLVIINQNTGSASPVGLLGFEDVASLAFDPNTNTLYGVDSVLDELITIDTNTGQGTSVGFTVFRNILGLAFDSNTNTLYGVNPDLDNNYLVTINTNNGVASMVGDIVGFEILISLTYDEATNTLYSADDMTGEFLSVNPVTAVGTVIGDIGFDNINGLATCSISEAQVPTLSEWGLIAMAAILGLVGLIIVRRKSVIA